jgi:hypothetical protein
MEEENMLCRLHLSWQTDHISTAIQPQVAVQMQFECSWHDCNRTVNQTCGPIAIQMQSACSQRVIKSLSGVGTTIHVFFSHSCLSFIISMLTSFSRALWDKGTMMMLIEWKIDWGDLPAWWRWARQWSWGRRSAPRRGPAAASPWP